MVVEKVYFIQAASGLVKIGRSTDVPRRKKALQLAHGERLKLLGAIPGGAVLERQFHERWAHLRQTGEWFLPAPELLRAIDKELAAPQLDLAGAKPRLNSKTGTERERLAQGLIDFFRARHPKQTSLRVAEETGIPEQTIRKWLDRSSAPNVMYFEPLLMTYGPSFLAAVWPSNELPSWLREAIALEQAQMLMSRIKSDMTALDDALAVARRGDIAEPLVAFAESRAAVSTEEPRP